MWLILYVLTVVAINYGFSVVPLVDLGAFGMWPPMSIFVGAVFIVRDYAQRDHGHYVIPAMLLAGLITWFAASPYIAVASVSAFAISEAIDWIAYTFSKQTFNRRVFISSAVSTPVDSAVFLSMIGAFSLTGVAIMTASKMLFAVIWLTKKQANILESQER